MRKKLENPLVDKMNQRSIHERVAISTVVVSIVALVSVAVILCVKSGENEKTKTQPHLKICTPEERRQVRQVLEKGRHATDVDVKNVLQNLENVLDQRLDCGWENVMALRDNLNSRHRP